MSGFIKFNWNGVKIMSLIDAQSNEAAMQGAHSILDRANEHVPLETGELMGTGQISIDGSEAAISYDTVYAARLHQHPEYNFRGQGRGRWLQDAVDEHAETLAAMGRAFKVL